METSDQTCCNGIRTCFQITPSIQPTYQHAETVKPSVKKNGVESQLYEFLDNLTADSNLRSRYKSADILTEIDELVANGSNINYTDKNNTDNDTVLLKVKQKNQIILRLSLFRIFIWFNGRRIFFRNDCV